MNMDNEVFVMNIVNMNDNVSDVDMMIIRGMKTSGVIKEQSARDTQHAKITTHLT